MFVLNINVSGTPRSFGIDIPKGHIEDKRVTGIKKRAGNLKKIGPALREVFVQEHEEIFKTEGNSIGQKWSRYTKEEMKRYVPWKIKKIGDVGILRWERGNEKLYPSLTGKGPDAVWKFDGNKVVYGSKLSYAKEHHEGSGYAKPWMGGYRLPKRALTGVSRAGANKLVRTVQRFIMSGETTSHGISGSGGI